MQNMKNEKINNNSNNNKKLEYGLNNLSFLDDIDEFIIDTDVDEAHINKVDLDQNNINKNTSYSERLYKNLHQDYTYKEDYYKQQSNKIKELKNKINKEKDIDYDSLNNAKSLEEAVDILQLEKLTEEKLDNNLINLTKAKVLEEETEFYAFLNIEFNILNKKMIECSKNCFDYEKIKDKLIDNSIKKSLNCQRNCRLYIDEKVKITEDYEKEVESNLKTCLQAKRILNNNNDLSLGFSKCYTKLITDLKEVRHKLKEEYLV